MKKRIVIILLFAIILPVHAQLKKSRIGSTSKQQVSISVGVNHPVMELKTKHGPNVQASYTYFFLPRLGLKGFADYNFFLGENDYNSHFASLGAEVVFNAYISTSGRKESSTASVIPDKIYIFGGVGVSGFFCTPKPQFTDGVTALFPVGFGIAWPVADNWNLGFEAAYNFTLTDKLDNIIGGKMTDSYPTLDVTLTYRIPNTHRRGTGFGYKSKKTRVCDPRKGCAITFE